MRIIKGIAIALVTMVAFIIAVFSEEYLRALQRRPIPIMHEDDGQAQVEAYVKPDFLWAGEAWWIDIESNAALHLSADGNWKAFVPAGKHKIFYNHDYTNTNEFGSGPWHETPARIIIRNE